MRSSLTVKLVAAIGRRRGPILTALVYSFAGKSFTREFYRGQGNLAEWRDYPKGLMSISFDVDYAGDAENLSGLVELLENLKLTASFAVVGRLVEIYPEQHRRIASAGHEILNHTYSHPDNEELHPHERFDDLSPEARKKQIEHCHQVCQELLDVSPLGFRAPHFGNVRGRDFYRVLAESGYLYSSSVISVDSPGFGLPFLTDSGIWELPVSCCPVHPFTVLDSWHALGKPQARHRKSGEFSRLVSESMSLVSRYGGYLNIYLDPRDVFKYTEVRQALEAVKSHPDPPAIVTYRKLLEILQSKSRKES